MIPVAGASRQNPPLAHDRRVAAVVLDMDGLMLDTEPIYKRAWQNAATECGFDLDDEFYLTLVGLPTPACEEALVGRFGRDFPLLEFSRRWPSLWKEDAELSGIATKPGLIEFLSFLTENRMPTAIATSSDHDYTAFSLRAARLEGRFDCVVTGDEIAHGKPAPDIYLESARRLGVDPMLCVALEDSEPGVFAASAAGMIAIMVPDLKEPSVEARSAAFCVVESLFDAREQIQLLLGGTR